jgi:hypothetical protein
VRERVPAVEIDEEKFRKTFPHLAMELEGKEKKVAIASVRSKVGSGDRAASGRLGSYDPDIIDFIRRCDTEEEAEEIIQYLEKRREISREYAKKLRKQLEGKGVRSFGPKKGDDYYLKKAGY